MHTWRSAAALHDSLTVAYRYCCVCRYAARSSSCRQSASESLVRSCEPERQWYPVREISGSRTANETPRGTKTRDHVTTAPHCEYRKLVDEVASNERHVPLVSGAAKLCSVEVAVVSARTTCEHCSSSSSSADDSMEKSRLDRLEAIEFTRRCVGRPSTRSTE